MTNYYPDNKGLKSVIQKNHGSFTDQTDFASKIPSKKAQN